MLREAHLQNLPWSDKTRTALFARQMEKCEKWLHSLPEGGVFTCKEKDASTLWQKSFDGEEHPMSPHIYTKDELQTRMMFSLPAETALLSESEEQLCEKLLETGGIMPLNNCDDMDAARNLVKRMWAGVIHIEGIAMLAIEPPLRLMLPLNNMSEDYTKLRNAILDVSREADGLLYLYGAIPAEEVFLTLSDVVRGTFADDEQLLRRFLRLNYDYTITPSSEMILIHPGLADPTSVRVQRDPWNGPHKDDPDMLDRACDGALWQEIGPFKHLLTLISGALRPEYEAPEAVQDLAFLCKQQAPLQDVQGVLASMLIVAPTDTMLDAVRQLHMQVARWQTMRAGVLQ